MLRRIVAEDIENRLRVFHTAPPHDVPQRQRTILSSNTHRGGRRGRMVALSLARLANEDWQDTATVHHHCSIITRGVAETKQDTLRKFSKYVIPSLCGVALRLVMKARWFGVYVACHGLLLCSVLHMGTASEPLRQGDCFGRKGHGHLPACCPAPCREDRRRRARCFRDGGRSANRNGLRRPCRSVPRSGKDLL